MRELGDKNRIRTCLQQLSQKRRGANLKNKVMATYKKALKPKLERIPSMGAHPFPHAVKQALSISRSFNRFDSSHFLPPH